MAAVNVDPSLQEKIVDQIHHYFGDKNLPKDKFLLRNIKYDNGWIPLQVMLRFNQLARLTTDTRVIVAALRTQTIPLMEISDDETKIRRSPAYPLP